MTTTYAHLDDPAEREWLTNLAPLDVLRNAHRIYDFMRETGVGADSYTRELAFEKVVDEFGIDYDVIYDAWLAEKPLTTVTINLLNLTKETA